MEDKLTGAEDSPEDIVDGMADAVVRELDAGSAEGMA